MASVNYVPLAAETELKSFKKRKPLIITALIMLIALLICICVGLYYFTESTTSESSIDTFTAVTTINPTSEPTLEPTVSPTHINPTNYSVYIANRMAQFCLASYCVDQGFHDMESWNCPACNKYFPNIRNVTVISTNYLHYDVNAFVLYDSEYFNLNGDKQPAIVIAFAGTDPLSITDWMDDLTFIEMKYPLSPPDTCSDCSVHKGFYNTYASVRGNIWNAVHKYKNAFGQDIAVQITGHSLGASLATHCALDGVLTHGIIPQLVYTFGQPRTGNKNWAKYYGQMVPVHYRVTYHQDPVPHLPFTWLGTEGEFWHVSREIFYQKHPNGSYVVCDGSGEDNKSCSDKWWIDVDVPDHLMYMGYDFTTNFVECKL